MKRLKLAALGILIAVLGMGLHYILPQVDVVNIVGAEVKRVDGPSSNKDVYQIMAKKKNGKSAVYRNQDALIYLKFTSANLQTDAASFAKKDEDTFVALRHYGWRIPFLSIFPNAVSAWEVEADYKHTPVFNVVFLTSLLALFFLARRRLRRLFSRRVTSEGSEPLGSAASEWFEAGSDVGGGSSDGGAGGGE